MKRRTFLFGCAGGAAVVGATVFLKNIENSPPQTPEHPLKLAVMADPHYLAPSLTDNGTCFERVIRNADGKVMDYSEQLAETFAEQIICEKPDVLLVVGDLTFNGERESHTAFAQKLQRVADAGITVLVMPGNHDLNNPMAAQFQGDGYQKVESIQGEEFASIYAPFGYETAVSRDKASLSYIAEPVQGLQILLVDANTADAPGSIKPETLHWAERQLKAAKKAGAQVIGASHQSLLEHNAIFTSGFTAQNGNQLATLYKKYGVLCNLCGHLHIQHIIESDEGLSEIITSSLAVAPNQYGILTVDYAGAEYHTETVDVSTWAKAQGSTDSNLLDFAAYSERFFKDTSRNQAEAELVGVSNAAEMVNFFAEVNADYFAGRLDKLDWDSDMWAAWSSQGGFLSIYLQSIRDDPAKNSTLCDL